MRLGKKNPRNPARISHHAVLFGVGFAGLEAPFLGVVTPPRQNFRNQANPETKKLRAPTQAAQASNVLPTARIKYNADLIAQIQLPQLKFLFE